MRGAKTRSLDLDTSNSRCLLETQVERVSKERVRILEFGERCVCIYIHIYIYIIYIDDIYIYISNEI